VIYYYVIRKQQQESAGDHRQPRRESALKEIKAPKSTLKKAMSSDQEFRPETTSSPKPKPARLLASSTPIKQPKIHKLEPTPVISTLPTEVQSAWISDLDDNSLSDSSDNPDDKIRDSLDLRRMVPFKTSTAPHDSCNINKNERKRKIVLSTTDR
jgi:hypothetical protein